MKKIIIITISCFIFQPIFCQENNSILCSDGLDNDGDGLIDCFDSDCTELPNEGCAICIDGLSFADSLIEYIPGCPQVDPDPFGAIGVSDRDGTGDVPEAVFLGEGGSIRLGFTNNMLTNSGNSDADLWIFEIGIEVESMDIELKPSNNFTLTQLQNLGVTDLDSDGYYEFGNVSGGNSSIDIDAVVQGFTFGQLQFDAIEIIDIVDRICIDGSPGADIDAVCALSSIVSTDCNGVLNGIAIIDDCGNCLEPNDPIFNACLDCAGIPNGNSLIDDCGNCLDPSDLNFSISCLKGIYIPNAFSPNGDQNNDRFLIFKNQESTAKVNKYFIYSRWGELIFSSENFEFNDSQNYWNGEFNGEIVNPGVYVYYIEVELNDKEIITFSNHVTVVK